MSDNEFTNYTVTIKYDAVPADSPQEAADDVVRMVARIATAGFRIFVDVENEETGEITNDIAVTLKEEKA